MRLIPTLLIAIAASSTREDYGHSARDEQLESGRSETPNIIVVDDESQIVKLFTMVLRGAGYNVRKSFSNGKDLIEFIAKIRPADKKALWPDAVILDYRMPVLDGMETAKLLRASYPTIKIIMISAYELPVESKGYFDSRLEKPVSGTQLLETISSVLGK